MTQHSNSTLYLELQTSADFFFLYYVQNQIKIQESLNPNIIRTLDKKLNKGLGGSKKAWK